MSPNWMDAALCAEIGGDLWYPEGDEGMAATADLADEARGVCIGCPSRLDCFRYSMDSAERWGVWAGLSERERTRERQRPVRRPAAEVLAEADARYHRRRARRLAFWEHEAVVAALNRRADELEELAA